jgi:UDP-N-acetylglucosamine:LPS N-acetylglucosamine transferase
MKIALVCSAGGHLTELKFLSEAFADHETFFVTYDGFRARDLEARTYLVEPIDTNPLRMARAFVRIGRLLLRERPDAIVSTGSEIAIPAFFWAELLGIETIYVESWCRIRALSTTGKVVYYLSDLFLVQWPDLAEKAGDRARYEGAVI